MATSTTAVPVEETRRRSSESQGAIVLRRFRKHKTAMFSIGVLGFFLLLALLVAVFARQSPLAFAKAILPAQVVAASTQSSQANSRSTRNCRAARQTSGLNQ